MLRDLTENLGGAPVASSIELPGREAAVEQPASGPPVGEPAPSDAGSAAAASHPQSDRPPLRNVAPGKLAYEVADLTEGLELRHGTIGNASLVFARLGSLGAKAGIRESDRWFCTRDDRFLKGFRELCYKRLGRGPGASMLAEAIAHLEARGFGCEREPVASRIASKDGAIWLSLGPATNEVVKITPVGWEVVEGGPVLFRHADNADTLPIPARGGSVDLLRRHLPNVSEAHWPALVGFIVATFVPEGAFPILCLSGPPESGKSFTTELVRAICDPVVGLDARGEFPEKEEDLFTIASGQHVLSFDNLSRVDADISDALCCLTTGAAAQVPNRPVENTTWNEIQVFLAATGMRLPTEAEWEYACRAGSTTAYPNNTNDDGLLGSIGWISTNAGGQSRPVGGKPSNRFGVYDMVGNVSELVYDFYAANFYTSNPVGNPAGPSSGEARVVRGWSYLPTTNSSNHRSSWRGSMGPTVGGSSIGFRVARSIDTVFAPQISTVDPSYGPPSGGTGVTIEGTNLINTTSVLVGGRPVTGLFVYTDELLESYGNVAFTTGPESSLGPKDVIVSTPGGAFVKPGAFRYLTTPSWATVLEADPSPSFVPDASMRDRIVATGLPWRVVDTATQVEMLLVPPGTYSMGCSASGTSGCNPEESPVHAVTITSPFYLGRYEVTQAEWQARMGSNPSNFKTASPQVPIESVPLRPVERVSWNMVANYLAGTGMRLPTEAEWEYAYRAGTTTAFHSSNLAPAGTNDESATGAGNIAWTSANSVAQTRPRSSKPANALGFHDMAGNVREWVNDWYSATYDGGSPASNPPGPATGTERVLRGGSWDVAPGEARSSARSKVPPGSTYESFGFRVARTP